MLAGTSRSTQPLITTSPRCRRAIPSASAAAIACASTRRALCTICAMSDAEELRAFSQRAVEDWNARRLDACYDTFHPDVKSHGPDGTKLHGVDALRTRYDAALAWCPDLAITVVACIADPERGFIASMQTERGTSVDGKPFGFDGMVFLRLGSDGRVHESWEQLRPLA